MNGTNGAKSVKAAKSGKSWKGLRSAFSPRWNPLTLKRKGSSLLINLVVYLLLIGFVFVFLYPFIFMLINSFKYEADLRTLNREWVLTSINLQNYSDAFRLLDYPRTLLNSVVLVLVSTLGHVIVCALIAYGLARFKFPGSKLIFCLVILSILIPPQILVMPLIIQYQRFGWMNTQLPIIIPSLFGFGLKSGLFIFLYMQFYKSMPRSYEEAAKLEGCTSYGIFWRIIFPISRTNMLVVGSLSAIWHWNDYFEPTTYMSSTTAPMILTQKLADIQNEIAMMYSNVSASGQVLSPVQLACCTIIILPILIYFFIVQRRFMEGIEFSGLAN